MQAQLSAEISPDISRFNISEIEAINVAPAPAEFARAYEEGMKVAFTRLEPLINQPYFRALSDETRKVRERLSRRGQASYTKYLSISELKALRQEIGGSLEEARRGLSGNELKPLYFLESVLCNPRYGEYLGAVIVPKAGPENRILKKARQLIWPGRACREATLYVKPRISGDGKVEGDKIEVEIPPHGFAVPRNGVLYSPESGLPVMTVREEGKAQEMIAPYLGHLGSSFPMENAREEVSYFSGVPEPAGPLAVQRHWFGTGPRRLFLRTLGDYASPDMGVRMTEAAREMAA